MKRSLRNRVAFVFGALAALLLSITPLPVSHLLRPDLVALLVLYQALYHPRQVGPGVAFALGLVQDALMLTPFGQHALGLTLLCYVAQGLRHRLALLPPLRQLPTIFLLLLGLQLLYGWLYAIGFSQLLGGSALASPLLAAALWVLVTLILAPAHRLQSRFAH